MRKKHLINTKAFFIRFIVLNGLLFFVFLLIPDLGSLLIMAFVGLIMCRYAGAKSKYVVGIFLGGIVSVFLVGSLAGMASDKFKYIQKRFTYFLSSDVDPQSRQI
jgi:cell division protein FtsW (lipid II flippase)